MVRVRFGLDLAGPVPGFWLRWFLLTRILFDAQQVARPQLFKPSHPALINLADRHHVQTVDALPPLLARVDQSGVTEHVNVLHHAEAREVWKGLRRFSVVVRGPGRGEGRE